VSNSSVHAIASIAKELECQLESIASCIASQLSGAGTNVASNTSGSRGADPSVVKPESQCAFRGKCMNGGQWS